MNWFEMITSYRPMLKFQYRIGQAKISSEVPASCQNRLQTRKRKKEKVKEKEKEKKKGYDVGSIWFG